MNDALGRMAVFASAERPLQIREASLPQPGQGEILVRNECTTLCRSDLYTYSGKRREKTPTVLGHEIVGRIIGFGHAAVAEDVRGEPLRVGDRVTWSIFASDPQGALARAGIPQKEKDLFKYGHEQLTAKSTFHGGLGTHTLLRRHTATIRVKESAPAQVMALANCAAATAAGALRMAEGIRGKNVLVSGAGMLGVFACAMCRAAGARRIVAVDPNPPRLEVSRTFGADFGLLPNTDLSTRLRERTDLSEVDIVLEFSGKAEAMEATLGVTGIGGVVVWVGATYPQRALSIEGEYVLRRLLTIRGLHNYNREDLVRAVEFIEEQHDQFPFADLVEDRFGLEQVNEAFEYALREHPYRVGIWLE